MEQKSSGRRTGAAEEARGGIKGLRRGRRRDWGPAGWGEGGRGREGGEGAWAGRDRSAHGVGVMGGGGEGRRAGCSPSDLPSGPWADAGGSSRVPPGPGPRGGRRQGSPMARGADARGWGRRLGARPPAPAAVSGPRPAERRLRAWTPRPRPRGSQPGAHALEGRGARAGRVAPGPSLGPPVPSRVPGGPIQLQTHGSRTEGWGWGWGRRGPAGARGRRGSPRGAGAGAGAGPGVGGPGCRGPGGPSPPPGAASLCGHIRKFHRGDA